MEQAWGRLGSWGLLLPQQRAASHLLPQLRRQTLSHYLCLSITRDSEIFTAVIIDSKIYRYNCFQEIAAVTSSLMLLCDRHRIVCLQDAHLPKQKPGPR